MSSKKKVCGCAFILDIGQTEHCLRGDEAKAFKQSHRDVISRTVKFFSEREMKEHKHVASLTTPEKIQSPPGSLMGVPTTLT